MSFSIKPVLLGLGLTVLSSQAIAEPFEVSGNVSLVSNYIFRGVSLSNDEAVIQGGFDLGHESGFYAGVWGSGATVGSEIDIYAGYNFAINDEFSIDVGVVQYEYPIAPDRSTEYHITASYAYFSASYHRDTTLETDYIELNASYDVNEQVTIDAHFGQVTMDEVPSGEDDSFYDYYLQVSYAFNDTYSAFAGFSDHEQDIEYSEAAFYVGLGGEF